MQERKVWASGCCCLSKAASSLLRYKALPSLHVADKGLSKAFCSQIISGYGKAGWSEVRICYDSVGKVMMKNGCSSNADKVDSGIQNLIDLCTS